MIDESSLYGESDPLIKTLYNINKDIPQDPFLYTGTSCVTGSLKMLVVAVNEDTFVSRITKQLESKYRNAPLQRKIQNLA